MKTLYLYAFLFPLFLIGCSSTYKLSDFSSRDKFYENFNEFAKDKAVKLTFNNDSLVNVVNGAVIENDTLFAFEQTGFRKYMKVANSEIKEMNYSRNYKTANLILTDGKHMQAENIKTSADSLEFTGIIINKDYISSIFKIREISYKNRGSGMLSGLLYGPLSGILLGFSQIIPVYTYEGFQSNIKSYSYPGGIAIGVVSGIGIGLIVGYIVGNNYTYQFNP